MLGDFWSNLYLINDRVNFFLEVELQKKVQIMEIEKGSGFFNN